MKEWSKNTKVLIGIACLVISLIIVAIIIKPINTKSVEEESSIEESTEDVIQIKSEIEEVTTEEPSIEEITKPDYSSLVIGTRYTLGTGVNVRNGPGSDYKIHKVIYDPFTPIQVIDESGEWVECLIDDDIYYINQRFIGEEYWIDIIKKRWEMEEKRKSSAYYQVLSDMTQDEKELLLKIVALEAGDEDFEGKVAVIEVILNRCISRDPAWPDRISDVIYQKGQFTTVKYLSHPYMVPGDEEEEALQYVYDNGPTAIRSFLDENGYDDINSLNYIFFATFKANGVKFVKHGGHYFSMSSKEKYKFKR